MSGARENETQPTTDERPRPTKLLLDHVFEIREGHILGAAIVHDELQQVILVPIVDEIGSS